MANDGKQMWLVEWTVDWEDGHGYDRHHVVFRSFKKAQDFGIEKVKARVSKSIEGRTISKEAINEFLNIFKHERDGEYYVAGITLKPVKVGDPR